MCIYIYIYGLYRGYIGIMKKKMEATIMGLYSDIIRIWDSKDILGQHLDSSRLLFFLGYALGGNPWLYKLHVKTQKTWISIFQVDDSFAIFGFVSY